MELKAVIDLAKFCEEHGFEWIELGESDTRVCLTLLVK